MLKLVVYGLALVGCWYLFQSYQQHQLKENMGVVLRDYSTLAGKITNPSERAQLTEKLGEVQQILQRHK